MEAGRGQPREASRVSTALQAQRLTLGSRGPGDLLVSRSLSGGLVYMPMLATARRPGLPLSARPSACTPRQERHDRMSRVRLSRQICAETCALSCADEAQDDVAGLRMELHLVLLAAGHEQHIRILGSQECLNGVLRPHLTAVRQRPDHRHRRRWPLYPRAACARAALGLPAPRHPGQKNSLHAQERMSPEPSPLATAPAEGGRPSPPHRVR